MFGIILERTPQMGKEIRLEPAEGEIYIINNDCELWHIHTYTKYICCACMKFVNAPVPC